MLKIEPLYTEEQLKVLALIGYVPALFSFVGSSSIIYNTSATYSTKSTTYERLMLGLSCMEVTSSAGFLFFGSWAVPKEAAALAWGASGTTETCEIAAVFITFLFGTMMYTAMLALYFCLQVRFEFRQKFIAKYIEPFLHGIPVALVVTICYFGLEGDYFNPLDRASGLCWVCDYPPNCTKDDSTACVRGEASMVMAVVAASGVIFLVFCMIVVCMSLILLKIVALEYRLKRYAIKRDKNRWKRSQQVGKQALQYIGFFLLCGIWIVVLQVMPTPHTWEYSYINFPIALVMKLMTPLQGFFNAIIYWKRKMNEGKRGGRGRYNTSSYTSSATGPTRRWNYSTNGTGNSSSTVGTRGGTYA